MTVIVSSVMGKGPFSGKLPVAAELLPAAVLAAPIALLTAPADSRGTADTPSVNWPDAAMPIVTALLACVLAPLAFCALSAAFVFELLIRMSQAVRVTTDIRHCIDVFL